MAVKKRKNVHASHNLIRNGRSDHKCSNCNATMMVHSEILKKPCSA